MLRFESEPACPSKLLIARCYSTIRARIRPNGFERILAHRIGCQRATASLSSRVASKQLGNYSEDASECQHLGTKKFGISTTLLRAPLSFLEGERYRRCSIVERVVSLSSAGWARCKNPSRLRKSSIPFGSGAYSRPSLSLRCSSLLSLLSPIVVTLVGRQSMTRSEGLDETVNEHRFRNSSPRDYRSQRRNQIRKCGVIFRRQRNTKTSLPRLRRGSLLFLSGSPFDYQFVQIEDFYTES